MRVSRWAVSPPELTVTEMLARRSHSSRRLLSLLAQPFVYNYNIYLHLSLKNNLSLLMNREYIEIPPCLISFLQIAGSLNSSKETLYHVMFLSWSLISHLIYIYTRGGGRLFSWSVIGSICGLWICDKYRSQVNRDWNAFRGWWDLDHLWISALTLRWLFNPNKCRINMQ